MSLQREHLIAIGLAVLGFQAPMDARAQQQVASPSLLQEVTVIARKVEESAQSVPITVTALSAADLGKSVVLNVQDLETRVTGLVVTPNTKGGSPNFSIRVAKTSGAEGGGITTYIDDVPMLSPQSIFYSLYDLSSVQTFKGPQGTLFGTNATGGAIIFRPNRPTKEFEASVDVGYGNYSRADFQGMVNIPVSDAFQFRLAGEIVRRDGYVKNLTPVNGNDELSDDRHESARLSARFSPTGGFTNDLVLDYFNENDQPRQAVPVFFSNPFLTAPVTNTFGCGILCGPFGLGATGAGIRLYNDHTVSLSANGATPNAITPTFNKARIWGAADTAAFDFSDQLSFKNVIAYRHEELNTFEDNDGTSLALVNGRTLQHNSQWTEEPSIRFTSTGGKFRLVSGLFLSHKKLDDGDAYNLAFLLDPSFVPFLPAPGAGLFPIPQISDNHYDRKLDSYAVYSQASIDLSDTLTATLGARYNRDHGTFKNQLRGGTGNGNAALGLSSAFLNPTGNSFLGDCRAASMAGYAGANLTECFANRSATWEAPSFTFSIENRFSDKSLLYFTTRGGYQAGGFNNEISNVELQTYNPEKVVDFETGLKSDWSLAGRPIRTNVDTFFGRYKNMQRQSNGSYTNGAQFQAIFNAGTSTYYGSDVEISVFPFESLELSGAWTYLHSEYDRFVIPAVPGGAGVFANPQDLSNSTLSLSPKNTVNVQASYHWPVPSRIGALSSTLSYYYRSAVLLNDFQTPGFEQYDSQKGYGLANATQDWENIFGSRLSVNLWIRNITDKKYAVQASNQTLTFGYATYLFGDPRTYGLNLHYKF